MQTAVVTLVIGAEFDALAKLTHPSLRAYAERIGAEFVVITEAKYHPANPCYEKLQCRELLDKYDRIVFLDTDILVSSRCLDLFSIVPLGQLGAFCEGKVLTNGMDGLTTAIPYWGDYTARSKEFFNAGVMVFDRSHKEIFTAPEVFHNNFFDNTWMVIQAFRHTVIYDIGPEFNFMCSLEWDKRFEKYIIHYASSVKDEIPKDLASGKFS